MANRHYENYILRLITGIILITAGIFLIIYANTNHIEKEDWYFWALGIAVIIIFGLLALGNAYVHKVKSDFIRKREKREGHSHSHSVHEEIP